MATVIDYSAGVPAPDAVKKAGHIGEVRYISPGREAWMKGKPVTKEQVEAAKAAGLKTAFVWQFGGANNPDAMRGAAGGKADAEAAKKKLEEIGCAGWPVFFAVDFDITLDQWNKVAVHYFRAAGEVLGTGWVGIYGHSRVCDWAREDGVIGKVADGRYLQWQTTAWSHGEISPHAVLLQDRHNVKGPDGVQVDINEVLHPYWGQGSIGVPQVTPNAGVGVDKPEPKGDTTMIKPNPKHRGDPLFLADLLRAWGLKVVEMPGWKQWGNGDFGYIKGVFAHHTGSNSTPASYIARNPRLNNQLSSQIHLGRDGTVTLCGVGVAWHAGKGSYPGWQTNNANWESIGIEAVSDGRSPWPEAQMVAYRKTCAAILWYLGHRSTVDHLLGHKEYSGAAQGKWDPGGIDMTKFRAEVQWWIDNPPAGVAGGKPKQEDKPMATTLDTVVQTFVPRSEFKDTLGNFIRHADKNSYMTLQEALVARERLERIEAKQDEILALLKEQKKAA